ncbi:beta-ketoacyl-[acyl-carrier-protein] synthase family protein [Sneathiella sp.]|uniref:beta-ketoacyl-[acyl-carrier-protein] synthase family protein n=1 Tax=Sneathiella sp. TaxID=1964365 RepID=UPI0035651E92
MSGSVYLQALGLINPLGAGKAAVSAPLFAGSTQGMGMRTHFLGERPVFVGSVEAVLPAIPPELSLYDSRNNRVMFAAIKEIEAEIQAAISKYGPDRVAVILGTSTSGISDNEPDIAHKTRTGEFPAGFDYDRQDNASLALFVRAYFKLTGLAMTVSTACTSSAKTLSSARRMIDAGICDAAIVGGADTLCKLTLNGFASLELLSETLCNPFSRNRGGINIGEAAAVFLMSREEADIRVAGIGETSDAYHMSTPDPEGTGAFNAMKSALLNGGLNHSDVGYLNLHGTATVLNDSMEAKAVAGVFGDIPCSSTKPLTGHTLGAAGATELAFLWLALHPQYAKQLLPPHIWDGERDEEIPALNLIGVGAAADQSRRAMMSNSFAFGGNNISVVLARE